MKKTLLAGLAVGMMVFGIAGTASATVLTFDDVTTLDGVFIPSGYGGLEWSNIAVQKANIVYSGSGYENGVVSGDYIAFNSGGTFAWTGATNFDFNGVFLTGAWFDGLNVDVLGWASDGATVLYSKTVTVNHDTPTWYDFNFLDVSYVSFETYGGTQAVDPTTAHNRQVVMDNLTINEPVPEPATMLLMGTGLTGLVAARRKKKA